MNEFIILISYSTHYNIGKVDDFTLRRPHTLERHGSDHYEKKCHELTWVEGGPCSAMNYANSRRT